MHGTIDSNLDAARDRASSTPLEDFDVSNPELFPSYTFWPYFERLRNEESIHYCRASQFGPYWSVTKYNDIMNVEISHAIFSSETSLGGIALRETPPDHRKPSFITMDRPEHDRQRKTVAPMFTPTNLDRLTDTIRECAAKCLDSLPRNETFDWAIGFRLN